jgi:LemA protein
MDTAATFLTIAAVGIFLLFVVRLYNRLVARRNAVDNAFGTIDVQLKLRCDLVPAVVDALRGYMEYERGTLEQLTSLRARATTQGVDAGTRLALDSQIGSLMTRVFALSENYPDLKSSASLLLLQRTLNEVEAQIAAARRTYNAAVTDYNTQIESFPANLGAPLLGFGRRALFETTGAEREPVPVSGLVAD